MVCVERRSSFDRWPARALAADLRPFCACGPLPGGRKLGAEAARSAPVLEPMRRVQRGPCAPSRTGPAATEAGAPCQSSVLLAKPAERKLARNATRHHRGPMMKYAG